MTNRQRIRIIPLALAAVVASASVAFAQVTQRPGVPRELENKLPTAPPPVPLPNFIIGPDDVLLISVLKAPEVSGEVRVRPDGKITLPFTNDIVASGSTTDQLKEKVIAELEKLYEKPTVFIVVKEIRSRLVYISGAVGKTGAYPLIGPMTVSQLITIAGDVLEYADKKNIMLISATLKDPKNPSQPLSYKINYEDIQKGRNLVKNNIELRPGDQVIVR